MQYQNFRQFSSKPPVFGSGQNNRFDNPEKVNSESNCLSLQAQSGGRAKGAAKGSCGETVVQKGVFGESVSSQGFQDLPGVLRENLKGAEKKRTLQKHPFGQPFFRTTPVPLLWRALKIGISEELIRKIFVLHGIKSCSQ